MHLHGQIRFKFYLLCCFFKHKFESKHLFHYIQISLPSNMFDDIFKTVICVLETGGEQAKKTETNVKEEIDSGNTP